MSDNPYASPQESAKLFSSTPEPGWTLNPASQGKRFINLVVDFSLLLLVNQAAQLGLLYVFFQMNPHVVDGFTPNEAAILNTLSFLVWISILVGYYLVMESLFQKTIGKLLTGTQVMNAEGGPPSFKQIAGRSFARLIPFDHFSFLSALPVGWHDSLSGTRVVSTRDLDQMPPGQQYG
ncbi:RDD family protein [Lignipirellula cremea]|uniref:RDD family protein n=1 Tax=Lignipirellula cremea TaxID=2528010 RepID=A0A518DXZ3_9BACT|nr:RDD family protein [Lignipirellula cremea]QDU96665.1 RDD family protein [Lignipirellula cremea]